MPYILKSNDCGAASTTPPRQCSQFISCKNPYTLTRERWTWPRRGMKDDEQQGVIYVRV
jgi:hypothetical protein